jgi:hypothetical protein
VEQPELHYHGVPIPRDLVGHPKRTAAWRRGVDDAIGTPELRGQIWLEETQVNNDKTARMRCAVSGHGSLIYTSDSSGPVCSTCGADVDAMTRDAGGVKLPDGHWEMNF